MKNTLYGDGIHDDTAAIQELIDNTPFELRLPAPSVHYLISRPLELPSNFKLVLPRFAKIRLAKDSNCVMLKNKTVNKMWTGKVDAYSYVNVFLPDYPCENIEVEGGIWDFNNKEQALNPAFWNTYCTSPDPIPDIEKQLCPPDLKDEWGMGYTGFGFLFFNVKNLRLSSMTLKDPVIYAVNLDMVSYFTVDNIIFDYNYGKLRAYNMDGIHVNGNCHFGTIENLKGACHDDLVALNADEGTCGPITNITVRGIFAEECHSAVRILSVHEPVKNIRISDVYGSYYQYCIGITKFYEGEGRGLFDGIVIDNVCVSKCLRRPEVNHGNGIVFPIVYVDKELLVKTLRISNVHYREYIAPFASVLGICEDSEIESLYLDHITTENYTEKEGKSLLSNLGVIDKIYANEIYENGKKIDL